MQEMMLYRGCTTPVRLPAYEAATKAVMERFGIHLHDMEDANCCGAQFVESVSPIAYVAMCGRILALAEKQGMDILAICGACSGSLKHNKHQLDTNAPIRKEVNSLLQEEGLQYTGKAQVKHLLQVFREDIGYKTIERTITKPYSGIRMAAHYGCHVTRPHEIVQVDDPENPTTIDRIIGLTGAESVDYVGKTRCCGGPLLAMDEELAGKIGREKVHNIAAAHADGIVTACGFCDIQLTQVQFGDEFNAKKRIPVIPLPQYLGVALGIDEEALGIHLNRIDPQQIILAVQEGR